MKTHYVLPAVLALVTAVTSAQSVANGLTYDPCEIYYSTHYGEASVSSAKEIYADYDDTNYGLTDGLSNEGGATGIVTFTDLAADAASEKYADMSDPTNYFKW